VGIRREARSVRFLLALCATFAAATTLATVSVAAADTRATPLPWTRTETAQLRSDLDRLVHTHPAARGAHVGAIVALADSGSVLYRHQADDAFQPASSLKLLVGSVALARLGPNYRFVTELRRTPTGLVLVGGGDPTLGAADLAEAATTAADKLGPPLPAYPQDLLLDISHVAPGDRRPAGWEVDDELADYAPVITGLPFEENVLHATLHGGQPGDAPTVSLQAPLVPEVSSASCQPGPTRLRLAIAARTVAVGEPADLDAHPGRCGEAVITGTVASGADGAIDLAVDEPEALAYATLAADFRAHGITLHPAPTDGPIPGVVDVPAPPLAAGTAGIMLVPSRATNVLWHHESAPLAQIVSDMWHRSDNFYAEMLLRELDWAATHAPATLAGGLALEHAWLQAAGGDPTTLTLADGSGLSQYNRISPRTLLAILRADWNGPNQAEVLAALPVAGRVYAKTGSMSHVRSLAGYVVTRTHGTVAFVLMLDDWMGSNADDDDIRTAFCARLAGQ